MPRGRPRKKPLEEIEQTVIIGPKSGDARIIVSIQYNNANLSRTLEIRDYSGSVPGPQRTANSLSTKIISLIRESFGAVRDVP